MALYENVAKTASDTIQQQGHTVGDALGAYGAAQKLQQDQQDFEMKKQQNEMAKSSWVASQIKAINNATGPSRQIIGEGFIKQLPGVVQGANMDNAKLLLKDPELSNASVQALGDVIAGRVTPQTFPGIITAFQQQPDEFRSTVMSIAGMKSKERAAANSAMAARVDEQRNQNAVAAGHAFEADPIIKLSKTSLNSLTKAKSILDNTSKALSPQDLNLAYNDYINSVAQGGAATEGKISRELPDTWTQDFEHYKQKYGLDSDMRGTPQGRKLIGDLQNNMGKVREDMGNQIADQAGNLAANYASNTNPRVQAIAQAKYKTYSAFRSGNRESVSGAAQAPGATPQQVAGGAAGPHGASVIQNGHTYNWNPSTGKYE